MTYYAYIQDGKMLASGLLESFSNPDWERVVLTHEQHQKILNDGAEVYLVDGEVQVVEGMKFKMKKLRPFLAKLEKGAEELRNLRAKNENLLALGKTSASERVLEKIDTLQNELLELEQEVKNTYGFTDAEIEDIIVNI